MQSSRMFLIEKKTLLPIVVLVGVSYSPTEAKVPGSIPTEFSTSVLCNTYLGHWACRLSPLSSPTFSIFHFLNSLLVSHFYYSFPLVLS